MRRGWRRRWRWRLRRQRCGIATVVGKISTEYDVMQEQRTRPHRRERGSAGSLAPTPEVARTRHASPATLWCLRINVGLCLPLPSTAHSEQSEQRPLCAAVWVVPSCRLIVVPLCLERGRCWLANRTTWSYLMEVHSKSFTQIGISMPFWGKFFLQSSLGNYLSWGF